MHVEGGALIGCTTAHMRDGHLGLASWLVAGWLDAAKWSTWASTWVVYTLVHLIWLKMAWSCILGEHSYHDAWPHKSNTAWMVRPTSIQLDVDIGPGQYPRRLQPSDENCTIPRMKCMWHNCTKSNHSWDEGLNSKSHHSKNEWELAHAP